MRGRLLLLLCACALVCVGFVGVARASTTTQYSPPVWFPLRGSWVIGCTWDNGCAGGYHGYQAIDIAKDGWGSQAGAPVYAAGAGYATVYQTGSTCGGTNAHANVVRVDHGNGSESYYWHLGSSATAVPGWVYTNTVLGYVGHTGYVDPCSFNHLHFEVRKNGYRVDPGPLQVCIGSRLSSYPAELGVASWSNMSPWTTVRNDDTSCVGSVPPPPPPPPTSSRAPADMNGDGKSDLVFGTGVNGGTTASHNFEIHALSGATNFQSPALDAATPFPSFKTTTTVPLVGDVDGDGRADACIITGMNGGKTASKKVELHCANGVEAVTPFAYAKTTTSVPLLGDADGDGRAELCMVTGVNGAKTPSGKIELRCGDGTAVVTTFAYAKTAQSVPLFADVNGDGRSDLCMLTGANSGKTTSKKVELHCANGLAAVTPFAYINTTHVLPFLLDLNGDGRADLVMVNGLNATKTPSGKVEVHAVDAGSGYTRALLDGATTMTAPLSTTKTKILSSSFAG